MSHQAPDDAQGELQGGIASLQSIGMLLGTVMFTQIFGWFMQPNSIIVSPSIGFVLAGLLLTLTLGFFLAMKETKPLTPP